MYTTCEDGKGRSVNHTRARSLSPRRAGPRAWAWHGVARRAVVHVRGAAGCDVQVRCGAT